MATAWPPWCQWIHTVQYSLNFTEGMNTASRTHAVASILYYQQLQGHHLSQYLLYSNPKNCQTCSLTVCLQDAVGLSSK